MEFYLTDVLRKRILLRIICVWILINRCAGAPDFTCIGYPPRVSSTNLTDVSLTAYLGGDDTTATTVSFNLGAITGASFTLPGTTYNGNDTTQYEAWHEIPASSDKERVGAFKCTVQQDGMSTNVIVPIVSKNAHFVQTSQTITVSRGDSVTIGVTTDLDPLPKVIWRKESGIIADTTANQLVYSIMNVDSSHQGIYEIYANKMRNEGFSAIIRLIVRGCPAGRYGPSCERICRICYNGGACHHETGECICAPGFSGASCQLVHGRNHFGQDGSFKCSPDGDSHSNGCQGQLFCLPDPYGCSCAAGYDGIDCMGDCPDGTYGPMCSQQCHCANGAVCRKDTGECPSGSCAPGYTGINCQIQDPCPSGPTGFVGDFCEFQCDCLSTQTCVALTDHAKCFSCTSAATSAPTGITQESLSISEYKFTWNAIQCGSTGVDFDLYHYRLINQADPEDILIGETGTTEVTLTGLTPCADYAFSVAGYTSASLVYSNEIMITTGTEVPSAVGGIEITPGATHAVVNISWTPNPTDPCPPTHYMLETFMNSQDQCMITSQWPDNITQVEGTYVTLMDLLPYTGYQYVLTSVNNGGSGGAIEFFYATAQAVPVNPPADVRNTVTAKKSLSFAWGEVPCGSRSGMISGYEYTLTNMKTGEVESGTTSFSVKQVTLSGLVECTTYNFTIAGRTSVGIGPYSTPLQVTTATEVPGSVEMIGFPGVINFDQTEVTWTPPTGACPATEYHVELIATFIDGCLGSNQTEFATTTSETTVIFRDLLANSVFSLIVTSINSAGRGGVIEAQFSTQQAVPLVAPQNVQTTVVTSSSITFTWDMIPCGSRRGDLKKYLYRLINARDTTQVIADEVSATTVTIEGLMSCSNYTFVVAAKTIDVGPYSEELLAPTTYTSAPSEVVSLAVAEPTNTNLVVSWQPPTSPCPATEYVVEHTLTSIDQCQDASVTTEILVAEGQTSVTISDLMAFSNYTISVWGRNIAGNGPEKSVDWTTGGLAPSDSVVNLTIASPSDTSLQLSWQPSTSSCPPNRYIIHYTFLNQDQCADVNIGPMYYTEVFQTAVLMSGLVPYSSYKVSVTPKNDAGVGMVTEVEGRTEERAPSAPPRGLTQTASTETSVTVSWDEVPCGNRGGNITQYRYDLNSAIFDNTPDRTAEITDLEPCTSYNFRVFPVNSGGRGMPGELTVQTLDGVPSPVQNLATIPKSSGFELSWQPSTGACQPDMFRITYELITQDQCQPPVNVSEITTIETEGTLVNITGLTPYSTYMISVIAVNGVGGSVEESIMAMTIESAPSAAPSAAITMATTDSVTVTWDELPCGTRGGEITTYKYQLQYNNALEAAGQTPNTTLTFLDLMPCSEYMFSISAVNNANMKGPSAVLMIPTAPSEVQNLTALPESSSDGASLSWQPPPGGCQIMQYRYQLRHSSDLVMAGQTTNATLTLSDLMPCSEYMIIISAVDTSGMKGPDAMFMITTAPASVQNLTATPTPSSDDFMVSWQPPPGGCQINEYKYQLQLNNNLVTSGQTADTSLMLPNLEPCSEYRFSVGAVDSTNVKGPDEIIRIQTEERAPLAVQNLTVTPKSSGDGFLVSWQQLSGGCQPSVYRVEHQLVNLDQCRPENQRVSGQVATRTQSDIEDLQAYSTYAINVLGINNAGEGIVVETMATTSQKAPRSAPTNITVNTDHGLQLTITWQPPPCGNRNGPISYTYKLTKLSDRTVVTGNTAEESMLFSNLTAGEQYMFEIAAMTDAGVGLYSTPIIRVVSELPATTSGYYTTQAPEDKTTSVVTSIAPNMTTSPDVTTGVSSSASMTTSVAGMLPNDTLTTSDTMTTGVPTTNYTVSTIVPSTMTSSDTVTTNVATTLTSSDTVTTNVLTTMTSSDTVTTNVPSTTMTSTDTVTTSVPPASMTPSMTSNIPSTVSSNDTVMTRVPSSTMTSDVPSTMMMTTTKMTPTLTTDVPSTVMSTVTTSVPTTKTSPSDKLTSPDVTTTTSYRTSPRDDKTTRLPTTSLASSSPTTKVPPTMKTSPPATTALPAYPMPPNLIMVGNGQNMLDIQWGPPGLDDGVNVQHYNVQYRASVKAYNPSYTPGEFTSYDASQLDSSCNPCKLTISELEPSTQYEVKVSAVIGGVFSEDAELKASTQIYNGLTAPTKPILNAGVSTKTSVAIGLPDVDDKYVSGFWIAVAKSGKRNRRRLKHPRQTQ
ncbi:phosphatidylinositol phosphatase PTPRQ-like [Amphiura filiformis]|uniref:phosphatidylinositol phosphatase PTPRQ-like n=1 Tax=Amphiura filiformis TaxID=82378 RepID=UPI003B20E549